MVIFGGIFIKDQISKVTGCSMTRIGTLDFDFNGGGCTVFNQDTIVLCFDYYHRKECQTATGPFESFVRTADSIYDHKLTRIAASKGTRSNNM